jgi:prepilin-type N-terminal cleavage/methylation domain-containing protein
MNRVQCSPRQRWARPAFTLIELMVVVANIGLLSAIIIPAVQSAREAGRRAQCFSNLRQLGVALQSYESVQNMFPPENRRSPQSRDPLRPVDRLFAEVRPSLRSGRPDHTRRKGNVHVRRSAMRSGRLCSVRVVLR